MLMRNVFSSGSAAVAEQWSHDDISSNTQDSHKKRLLGTQPDSPASGELISTAVPADIAAAADAGPSPTAAAAAAQPARHTGLVGASAAAGEDLSDASFEQLCNDGSQWSWSNWQVKLYRWTPLWVKQIYLFVMTLTLPTNFLMVSVTGAPSNFFARVMAVRCTHM